MPVFARRRHAFVLALLLPFAAPAQTLPRPAEFYFDRDDTVAAPIVVVTQSDDEKAIALLLRQRDRGGRDADKATAQLARIAMASGRTDTGHALYRELLARATVGGSLRQSVAWNYGWDLYRAGDVEGALRQWSDALSGRLAKPAWAPPTFALALWKLDRKPEAVRWYAAAVRTEPQQWIDPARLPTLLPDWTQADRDTLAEVQAAWAKDPPGWP